MENVEIKYELIAIYKGSNYRFNDDKKTKVIRKRFDSVEEITPYIEKNMFIDNSSSFLRLSQYEVKKLTIETIFSKYYEEQ